MRTAAWRTSPRAREALYVDANSIGPGLAEKLSVRLAGCGRGFVDAAINGLASNAAASGTLFLSGPRASEVAELFEGACRCSCWALTRPPRRP